MKTHPKVIASLLGIAFAVGGCASGVLLAIVIGVCTHSGLLGICGPYGPAAGLVGRIVVGSPLLGVIVGAIGGRHWYKRHVKGNAGIAP